MTAKAFGPDYRLLLTTGEHFGGLRNFGVLIPRTAETQETRETQEIRCEGSSKSEDFV